MGKIGLEIDRINSGNVGEGDRRDVPCCRRFMCAAGRCRSMRDQTGSDNRRLQESRYGYALSVTDWVLMARTLTILARLAQPVPV